MTDLIIRCFLASSCLLLAMSIATHPSAVPRPLVSDNRIIPATLLHQLSAEDALLDRRLTGIHLEDSELEPALRLLESASHLNIDDDWKSLEGTGVDHHAPVNVRLHEGSLRQFLTYLAEDVGGGTTRLSCGAQGTSVKFAPIESLRMETAEVYDLRPLVRRIQLSTPPDRQASTTDDAARKIVEIVRHDVMDDYWQYGMHSRGGVIEIGGLMVVTAGKNFQRKTATLLTQLDLALKR